MPSDSSDIDNALVAKLGADLQLLALCPNGVYMDIAPPGSTRFVIVSIEGTLDVDVFEGRAYEDILYAVSARMLDSVGGNIKAAAARIDALLQDQELVVAGYAWMATFRESRIRFPEPDDADTSILWHHRGGVYRVQMTPIPPGVAGDPLGAQETLAAKGQEP